MESFKQICSWSTYYLLVHMYVYEIAGTRSSCIANVRYDHLKLYFVIFCSDDFHFTLILFEFCYTHMSIIHTITNSKSPSNKTNYRSSHVVYQNNSTCYRLHMCSRTRLLFGIHLLHHDSRCAGESGILCLLMRSDYAPVPFIARSIWDSFCVSLRRMRPSVRMLMSESYRTSISHPSQNPYTCMCSYKQTSHRSQYAV